MSKIDDFYVGQTVWWVCDGPIKIDAGGKELEDHGDWILYRGTVMAINGEDITVREGHYRDEPTETYNDKETDPENAIFECVGTAKDTFLTPEEAIADAVELFKSFMNNQLDWYKQHPVKES